MSLEALGSIEVFSVSKQSEAIWRAPVALSVITREDIRRSGATSIPEVLRLAPGVEVQRLDASHWAVGIRGFGDQFSKSLLVLIDGRNIYSPLFAGIFWPAYDMFLDDVDRIEVIRGPGGTIWGGNAVNGVINIVTKRAVDTHGSLVAAGAGTVDHGTAGVRYGGGNGRNLDYRFYANGLAGGPQYHPDGIDFDANSWMSQTGFRADWNSGSGQSFTLQGDVSTGRHGQRVATSTFTPPAIFALDGMADTFGGNLVAVWERRLRKGDVHVQAYYDRTVWEAPHFEERRDTVDLDYVQSTTAWSRQKVNWGAGLRWSPSTFTQTLPTLDFNPREETNRISSAFAQDEIQLVDERLAVTIGSKIEHNTYTGFEIQPGARLLWTPAARQTVWSAVTRAVRTPSRIERAVESTSLSSLAGPVFLEVVGSVDFASEELVGYEAGYRTLVGDVYLDATVFHNEHNGLAGFGRNTLTLEGPADARRYVVRVPYVNGINGTSEGFELSPDWHPLRAWRLNGSYALRHVDLHSEPVNIDAKAVPRYEGSTPQHLVRVQSQLSLPRGWEVDAVYRYAGRLPARLVDAYHTADARIGARIANGVRLSLEGQNLLQPRHAEFSPQIGIRRSAYVKLTWERASLR
jgi:iron complex outermembrane receptor protein